MSSASALNKHLGKTFVHDKTNNKYQLLLVSNVYSTSDAFIPTAIYKSLGNGVIWSRPISEFVTRFSLLKE